MHVVHSSASVNVSLNVREGILDGAGGGQALCMFGLVLVSGEGVCCQAIDRSVGRVSESVRQLRRLRVCVWKRAGLKQIKSSGFEGQCRKTCGETESERERERENELEKRTALVVSERASTITAIYLLVAHLWFLACLQSSWLCQFFTSPCSRARMCSVTASFSLRSYSVTLSDKIIVRDEYVLIPEISCVNLQENNILRIYNHYSRP